MNDSPAMSPRFAPEALAEIRVRAMLSMKDFNRDRITDVKSGGQTYRSHTTDAEFGGETIFAVQRALREGIGGFRPGPEMPGLLETHDGKPDAPAAN